VGSFIAGIIRDPTPTGDAQTAFCFYPAKAPHRQGTAIKELTL